MPIYVFVHEKKGQCRDPVEILLPMGIKAPDCPVCKEKLVSVPAAFCNPGNVLCGSNLREKGFTRLVRKDKGVYEKE